MITLATLPQATAQEVFDQVKNHLLTQNAKSMNAMDCAYRGDYGLKCAAGCLIADDEYQREMDDGDDKGSAWDSLIDMGFAPVEHSKLIEELQFIHDNIPVEEWGAELQVFASKNDLFFK